MFDKIKGVLRAKEKKKSNLNGSNSEPYSKMGSETVTGYTKEGVKVLIPKSAWRKSVPGWLDKVKDNPDELYDSIVMCLMDGFYQECLQPAKRLYEIDKNKERSSNILGITLMENGLLDEAEEILQNYLRENSDSGVIRTNLAKVFSRSGDGKKANENLQTALKADPNQQNALVWWIAIHHEKNEEEKGYQFLEEISRIEKSWYPQLYLAKRCLDKRDLDGAKSYYKKILKVVSNNGEALKCISGDLGSKGYPREALELILPLYDPKQHGPWAGLNLIQACIETKNQKTGLKLCDDLEKLQRLDLKQRINNLKEKLKSMK